MRPAPPVSPVYMWVEGAALLPVVTWEGCRAPTRSALRRPQARVCPAAVPIRIKRFWAPSSDGHPRDLFIPNQENRELQRPDGTKIADKYAAFFDPSVPLTSAVSDTAIDALSGDNNDAYWTGLLQDGNVDTS